MNQLINIILIVFLAVMTSQSTFADSQTNSIEAAVNNPARSQQDRKRDATSKPIEVLQFFGVKPGMKILDYLSGGGYYSEILSYAVGDEGKAVAHTNEAYMKFVGDAITKRFGDGRLPKVTRLTSEVPAMGLGNESYDMILMVMTYHDIYYVADYWAAVDRENWFHQIHSALKPGGILAIIDHSARAGTGIIAAQNLHRIDEEFSIKDIESAGFTLQASSDILRDVDDHRTVQVFDESIRGKTDRFVHRYLKK